MEGGKPEKNPQSKVRTNNKLNPHETVTTREVENTTDNNKHLHSCIHCLVNYHRFSCLLINVMIHAKVRCNSVDYHAVIRCHWRVLYVQSDENKNNSL